MNWRKRQLGEFFSVKHGYAFKGKYFSDTGNHVVLTPGNFLEQGGFVDKGDKEKFYTAQPPKEYILQKGDLIIAMTEQSEGLLGSSALVPKDDYYLHNQRLGLVVDLDKQELNEKFLYYLFNTHLVRSQIRATATGLKVKHTAPSRICAVNVPLPPLPTQQRIADILSAYDDLIDVNRRRMALLEESMHRLYREWFVYLRFPGHEETEIVDGVPAGWEERPIEGTFDTLGGGTPLRKEERYWQNGTITWYTPSDLTGAGTMFMEMSSDLISQEGLSSSSAKLFPPFSVMMTSRATIGVVAINTTEASTNQGFITCLPNERVSTYFLYCWLNANIDLFERLATGATYKEISKGVFRKIPMTLPAQEMVNEFEEMAKPLGQKILNLQRQSRLLAEARDALLPRLMNGSLIV